MSSYDKVLADYGQLEPVDVPVSWDATVTVHPITVDRFIDTAEGDDKPVYKLLASAVEINGEYWTANQWANLPKKAMGDVTAIYDVYCDLNGSDEELAKK